MNIIETMAYKFISKCPVKNIPGVELFKRIGNKKAQKELTRRGWDVKAILRANPNRPLV